MSSQVMTSQTFLFAPLNGYGHTNACIGVAEPLLAKGHKVVFAVDSCWKKMLQSYGFEVELMTEENNNEKPSEQWAEMIERMAPLLRSPPLELLVTTDPDAMREMADLIIKNDPIYEEIIKRVKPDVIVVDSYHYVPSVVNSGIPWIYLFSAGPLGISTDNVPPAYSGFAANSDFQEWVKFRSAVEEAFAQVWTEYNTFVTSRGTPQLTRKDWFTNPSPYANIYMFPEELDYTDLRKTPPKWHRFDSFVRLREEKFEMPEKLKGKPGKLIYLSMGSFGSADVSLMKKLISILAKSSHRYIVSKGPRADQFELADNMWGEAMVPQTQVLKIVDLIITHGGNNSLTEAFYFGVPTIILPLFGDQFDNAQRIHEKNLGEKLSPYQMKDSELLETIERVVNNEELRSKMLEISKRIQNSKSQQRAAELVESFASKKEVNNH